MKCLYLVSVVFHVAAGCALSADNDQVHTIRRRGDSVLLPCSCSDLHTKPQKLTWGTFRTGPYTEVLNDEHYRGRLQLINKISPANLSLFISDLRVEDQGYYRCSTEKEYRDIWLYVKGCEPVKKTEVERVTVFTGESVVLPCVCTDIQDKPQDLKWDFYRNNHYQNIYPKQTGHHRNRVKLVSNNSPGNVSLLISDLTEEDQGVYRCSVQADSRDIRLSVKVKRETSTRRKTKTKPPSKQRQSKTTHSPPASTSALDQGRRETSTHLRKTDTAFTSEQPHSKTTHSPPASSSTTPKQDKGQMHNSLPLGILAVLLLVIVAFICWRCRGGRCGDNTITERCQGCKKKQKTDAIYANVSHNNKAGAAQVQINTGEETEYACIKKTTAKKK
ncbi:uncharacterized protein Hap1MRO34_000258 [Clarias gariepinus]